MNIQSQNYCPQCGQAVSRGVKGLCPSCLALIAFGSEEQKTLPPRTDGSKAEAKPLLSVTARYVGDYELNEEIARGGMGVVYKARQTSLDRTVAVKMILGAQFATDEDVQRFRSEAEAAANLQHPNIVAIHETGEHEGRHYFSMDFVEGSNLNQVLNGKPLPPAQAANLLKTIADAVHFAHQRGTLHRDLKPHNILIDTHGRPRITDFGLAKRIERDNALTQTGAVMGSPAYISPEQASGRTDLVGPQSDVYSLGAILYQMLTGKPPFGGGSPLETIQRVRESAPVPPSKLNPQTPVDLETVCLKCLEKNPERRYHSARELAEELERFLKHEPVLAKPASKWRKAWAWSLQNPWAIIGIAACLSLIPLAIGFGLWERVRYLERQTLPQFLDPGVVIGISYLFLLPTMILGRWLKARRNRNLPVTQFHLGMLAMGGLVVVGLGLYSNMLLIRLYVWQAHFPLFAFKLPALVAAFLGVPLVLCWVGGILIWQALNRQQAQWFGATSAESEWLPRQAQRYSTLAFVKATVINMIWYLAAANAAIRIGWLRNWLNVSADSSELKSLLLVWFLTIALSVTYACWVWATRKIYQRPPIVHAFLAIFFAGSTLSWFSSPLFSVLSPALIVAAIVTGVAGGWMQIKLVKIDGHESAEPLRPLVLDEMFQWNARALAISTFVALVALSLAGTAFVSREYPVVLYGFMAVAGASWPALFLAARACAGRLRELFVSILILQSLLVFVVAAFGFSKFQLNVFANFAVGLAAGIGLIYAGRIRTKST